MEKSVFLFHPKALIHHFTRTVFLHKDIVCDFHTPVHFYVRVRVRVRAESRSDEAHNDMLGRAVRHSHIKVLKWLHATFKGTKYETDLIANARIAYSHAQERNRFNIIIWLRATYGIE